MTNVFSWQNSISLCPASFSIPKPNLPLPQVFLDFLLLHSSPLQWKGHLFWVLVLKGLVGLHRTVQLKLLQCYWLGHRLGLLWYLIFCLENEQRCFYSFWDCTQVLHFRLFWLWGLLHFFYRTLAHSSRYNGQWIKFQAIHPFQTVLVSWFLKCRCSYMPSPVWPLPICLDSWT